MNSRVPHLGAGLWLCLSLSAFAQTPLPTLSAEQVIAQSYPSVAMVLASRAPNDTTTTVGSAIVVRQDGILLTAYHLVKDQYALQVRFKNGEIFDNVILLGVDARRDVAAIRVSATKLPVMTPADAADSKAGDPVVVVSHAAALPWSAASGIVSAYLADEVPGAGTGFRLLQFTAPISPGSSGGVVVDNRGRALGLIVSTLAAGQNVNFAVPLESVAGLAATAATKAFANGGAITSPFASPAPGTSQATSSSSAVATPDAPEKSDLLSASRDPIYILRNFKTMFVDCIGAQYFGSDQMKAALSRNKDFAALNIRVVDDPKLADAVLKVGYTFAWDYPFELKHQNTATQLLAGKGTGPFSGPAGAASVAKEFVKLAKPYRSAKADAKK